MKKFIKKGMVLIVIGIVLLATSKNAHAGAWYSSNYRDWSQYQSNYQSMREVGCNIVANAKMIYDTGVDRSPEFNPDKLLEWFAKPENRYVLDINYNLNLQSWEASQNYAKSKGKSLVYMPNVKGTSNAQIWSNIKNNYRTIIQVQTGVDPQTGAPLYHFVYVNNEKSTQNNIMIDDSASDYILGTRSLNNYSTRVNSFVYWTDGDNLNREIPTIEKAFIDIPSMTEDTFTVKAKITSPGKIDKVQFATWTLNYDENGKEQSDEISQDDKIYHVPTYNSSTGYYEYTVRKSEHNNEDGVYRVHILAFNKFNQRSKLTMQYIPMGSTVNTSLGNDFYARIIPSMDETNTWVVGVEHADWSRSYLSLKRRNNEDESQIYRFKKNSDNTYSIINKKNGLYFDIEGNEDKSGRYYELFASNNQNNQKFYLMNYNNGIRIVPKLATQVMGMDLVGAKLVESSKFMLYEAKTPNKLNQTYKIVKLATNLSLDKDNIEIKEEEEELVNVTIEPFNTDSELEWTSSNENIATVQNNGVIKGIKEGHATITVKTKDGSNISKTISVEVLKGKKVGLVEENGNTYFYNENGVLQKGMITDSKTQKQYYSNNEGILQKGLIELNGKKYFFKDDYTMAKGEFIKVEEKIYYFGAASGALQKSGWYEKDGKKYYEDKTTGEIAVGLKTIDNKQYYFKENGVMAKGEFATVDGKIYYFGAASGSLQKSGWYEKDGKKYYEDKTTGEIAVGMKTIDGNTYYFNEKGVMQKGKFATVDGKIYYFGATSGSLQKSGWYEKDGKKYYEDKTTGEIAVGVKTIDNKKYYFNNSGVLQKNGFIYKGDKTYYAESTGELKIGLTTINNNTYYFYETAEMAKGQFVKLN
ncbi:MAG: Ig-like domain-containing protein, partial [Bacilli bacterium]|nr:Ig-like domain-containing protein [Bacilli bacterium]